MVLQLSTYQKHAIPQNQLMMKLQIVHNDLDTNFLLTDLQLNMYKKKHVVLQSYLSRYRTCQCIYAFGKRKQSSPLRFNLRQEG